MWIHWPFFPKTWSKGHWPLDDLWPHVCWGHMCDSTQGSLCPSPMGINQCMWIQWSILQITTYIHTTSILHTFYVQNEWSHSLLLNSVQARQKDICDMIKGNESDVMNIDFELQAKRGDKFLCFTLFLNFSELFISLQPHIHLTWVRINMYFIWTSDLYQEIKIKYCQHVTHSPWSCQIFIFYFIITLPQKQPFCLL